MPSIEDLEADIDEIQIELIFNITMFMILWSAVILINDWISK